ncbi:MAG: SCP2 sterol-binding domain-containing protein [Chloroflexota bacterium]
MAQEFPSEEWLHEFHRTLNSDERYAAVAKNWEGDLSFVIELDEGGTPVVMYLDLWHGKCRSVSFHRGSENAPQAKFVLRAPLANIRKILRGELDPMQAMVTRRLRVDGPMAYMLRNVPTVLDFVRVARSIPIEG